MELLLLSPPPDSPSLVADCPSECLNRAEARATLTNFELFLFESWPSCRKSEFFPSADFFDPKGSVVSSTGVSAGTP